MRSKLTERRAAIRLRQDGTSLNEISQHLGVAKSSVSIWCRDICLTKNQLSRLREKGIPGRKLGSLANKAKRQKEISLIRKDAKEDFVKLEKNQSERLKDIGTALYWAEGAKRGSRQIDFTNSDPEMVRIMMLWLRVVHRVPEEKFKVSIYYHVGQNETKIKKYWSEITGVPLGQFHKSIFKAEGTGHRRNILYNGTCKVRVCNSNLLHRVLAWIEQFYI